jgi:hypothetical protein
MSITKDLPPLPASMRALVTNRFGYPVPWFARDLDRLSSIDVAKRRRALYEGLCWICGAPRGSRFTFVFGPAQVATRRTTEPPSHPACAAFAVAACPFLIAPQYRRQAEFRDDVADTHARHNPGCFALWRTRSYRRDGDYLVVGAPVKVDWFGHGQRADRAAIVAAFEPYRSEIPPEWFAAAMAYLPAEDDRSPARKISTKRKQIL